MGFIKKKPLPDGGITVREALDWCDRYYSREEVLKRWGSFDAFRNVWEKDIAEVRSSGRKVEFEVSTFCKRWEKGQCPFSPTCPYTKEKCIFIHIPLEQCERCDAQFHFHLHGVVYVEEDKRL